MGQSVQAILSPAKQLSVQKPQKKSAACGV